MPVHRKKVLVAMSGGVDSSVAAAMLQREGYEVVGCFMRLGSPGETLDELIPADEACAANAAQAKGSRALAQVKIGHQGCCSINDAADARLVAAQLGIPFYVCNFKKDFGRIIDYFVDEYANGRTPNPCVRCNDWLKFGRLHEYALQIGAEFVASGHYARVTPDVPSDSYETIEQGHGELGVGHADRADAVHAPRPIPDTPAPPPASHRTGPRGPSLLRGIDHTKDQSYVLFGMPRAQLEHTLLPIGGMQKSEVRDLAKTLGLPVFDKPDSQEICFVPDNNYAGLVESRRPETARSGEIVDTNGRVVGSHDGQHKYTIGQRRGVGVAFGHPIYVIGKDAATNRIIVGEKDRLAALGCVAGEANWLVDPDKLDTDNDGWFSCFAKYRYNTPPVAARARRGHDENVPTPSGRPGTFEVRFDETQHAVAPGQAVVLYGEADPDRVLGGGWISSAL